MASTIKLKNSTTAGNTPSSLETGEVAINVADGNLFYGSASAVLQNFVVDELEVKGNLTAQQYIVSSSVTYTTQSFSSGSTAFGDSTDDTHVFTGNVTASGNISASGTIVGFNLSGTNTGDQDLSSYIQASQTSSFLTAADTGSLITSAQTSSFLTAADTGSLITSAQTSSFSTATGVEDNADVTDATNVQAAGALMDSELTDLAAVKAINQGLTTTSNVVFNNITSSANISASGVITAEGLVISDDATIEDALTVKDLIQITKTGAGSNEILFQILEDGVVKFKVDGEGDTTANTLRVSSDGTASSPAIAFGTDTNTGIYQPADNEISLQVAGGTTELTVDTDGVDIQGHITASGNISASGTIKAATLDAAAVSDTLAAAIVAEIDNDEIPVAKLAEDSISGVTLGGNLNNLTVDNATLQLNSGTTFNGSAARTISIKDGGVDSDALAANVAVTQLTSSIISASGDIFCTNITIAEDIVSVGDDIILKDNLVVSSSAGVISFRGTAGGSNEGITYLDSAGGARYALLLPGSDVVALTNRAADGIVQIRVSNSSGGGGSNEITVAEFDDDKITHKVKSEIRLEKTSNTDADYNGDVVFFGGTTGMTAGRIYHFKSDGTWELANPNAVATSDGLLAVALGAASDTNGMLLKGMVTLDHDPGAVGDVLYLDEQQVSSKYGAATSGAPAGTGDVVRIIGYCLDASNGQIYFDPSKDHIVHA